MKDEIQILIEDIDNITYVLMQFCKNIEQNENERAILSIVKCLQEKTEQLYININKF